MNVAVALGSAGRKPWLGQGNLPRQMCGGAVLCGEVQHTHTRTHTYLGVKALSQDLHSAFQTLRASQGTAQCHLGISVSRESQMKSQK